MRPVAIVGAYEERHAAIRDRRLEEIIFYATAAALADAGVQRADLDSVVLGASDELDGRSISSMLCAAPAGAVLKDEMKTTTSGLHALALGAMRVQSGLFDLSVVVSWSQSSEADVAAVEWTALDPFVGRAIGLISPVATAVQANAYLQHFGRDASDLDRYAAVKRSRAGAAPPSARSSAARDASDYVAFPLRGTHLSPIVDGVAAVVLASPAACASRQFRHQPVWLRGIGWSTESYTVAERPLWEWTALRRATADAVARAGFGLDSITRFEVDDYSILHEALAVEALGLAQPGAGFDYLMAAPASAVNAAGGGFRGYPLVCAGLCRCAASFAAMAGTDAPHRALVNGTAGIAAQGHVVALLEQQ